MSIDLAEDVEDTDDVVLEEPTGLKRYKPGDIVWVRGRVTEVDFDSPSEMYEIVTGVDENGEGYVDESWYAETAVTTFENGDEGLEAGDFVKFRNLPAGRPRLGRIIALRKGRAWIDWEPFDESVDASAAASLSVLMKATPEEIAEVKGSRRA